MKILFLSKSKKYTNKLLNYLIENHEVAGVVCTKLEDFINTEMYGICKKNSINIFDNTTLYEVLNNGKLGKIDLAVSSIYGRLIKKDLIDYVDGKCINFHHGPLPQYRGLFVCNHGILNEENEWGVTAHFVSEQLDMGDIIEIDQFPINSEDITIKELNELAQKKSYELSIKIINCFAQNKNINRYPQGHGNYYSREDFENVKKITMNETADEIHKKIRAFWFPPYEGAYIEIDGQKFTLVNDKILKQIK